MECGRCSPVLTRPSRSADLSLLDIKAWQFKPHWVAFLPDALAKQSRQGKPLTEFFPSFPDNHTLCPVATTRAYKAKTVPSRKEETNSPYQAPRVSNTTACWLNLSYRMQELIHLLPHIISNSMQPLRGLRHSRIIIQKAQSRISTLLFAACNDGQYQYTSMYSRTIYELENF